MAAGLDGCTEDWMGAGLSSHRPGTLLKSGSG